MRNARNGVRDNCVLYRVSATGDISREDSKTSLPVRIIYVDNGRLARGRTLLNTNYSFLLFFERKNRTYCRQGSSYLCRRSPPLLVCSVFLFVVLQTRGPINGTIDPQTENRCPGTRRTRVRRVPDIDTLSESQVLDNVTSQTPG